MHLHKLPVSAFFASWSVILLDFVEHNFFSTKPVKAITKPGVQNPHWLPWQFIIAFCTLVKPAFSAESDNLFLVAGVVANASTVTKLEPSICASVVMHEFIGKKIFFCFPV